LNKIIKNKENENIDFYEKYKKEYKINIENEFILNSFLEKNDKKYLKNFSHKILKKYE